MINFRKIEIFILFSLISTTLSLLTCDKSGPKYSLKPGTIERFESPDYPLSLSTGKTNGTVSCSATFTRSDNSGELFLVFYNGHTTHIQADGVLFYPYINNATTRDYQSGIDLYVTKDKPEFSFSYLPYSDSSDWSAFQALVYAPDATASTKCLFDLRNFTLTDNTEIIPLHGIDNSMNNKTCFWKFMIPDGYKLKVNVLYFSGENDSLLVDSGNAASTIEITSSGAYYVTGKTFQLFYNKFANKKIITGMTATVSAVKITTPSTTPSCNATSNFDPKKGYGNSQTCSSTIKPTTGKLYKMELTKQYIENNVDKLMMTNKNGVSLLLNSNPLYLEPTVDSDYNVKFTSDDSIIQAGYELKQTEINCKCGPVKRIIPCYGFAFFNIMSDDSNDLYTEGSPGYCSNMDCDYEYVVADNCSANSLSLSIFSNLRPDTSDTFGFYVNGNVETIIDNTKNSSFGGRTYYKSQKLTGKFMSSGPSSDMYYQPYVTVLISVVGYVKTTDIELTEAEPVYFLDLNQYYYGFHNVYVKSGYTLDAFFIFGDYDSTVLSQYELFDGYTKYKRLDTIKQPSNSSFPYHYASKTGSIQILSTTSMRGSIFFRIREVHTKNCQTYSNVLQLDLRSTIAGVYALPTDLSATGAAGPCLYTIVSYPDYTNPNYVQFALSNLYTSSSNVTVLAGIDPKYPIFSFNSTTAKEWNDVTLKGPYNSFVVNDAGLATFTIRYAQSSFIQNYTSNVKNIQGVAYSDNFSNTKLKPFNNTKSIGLVETPTGKGSVTFTCKFLDLGKNDGLFVGKEEITSVGQKVTINSGAVDVRYKWYDPSKRGFLLEFVSDDSSASSYQVCNLGLLVMMSLYYLI